MIVLLKDRKNLPSSAVKIDLDHFVAEAWKLFSNDRYCSYVTEGRGIRSYEMDAIGGGFVERYSIANRSQTLLYVVPSGEYQAQYDQWTDREYYRYELIVPEVVNVDNCIQATKGIFRKIDSIPDKDPCFTSDTGSKYWYTEEGMIRYSDHWGVVSYSRWGYEDEIGPWGNDDDFPCEKGQFKLGFVAWSDLEIIVPNFNNRFDVEGAIERAERYLSKSKHAQFCTVSGVPFFK